MSTNFTITGEGLVPEPAYEVAPPGEQGEKGGRQGGVDRRLHLPQRRRGGRGGGGGQGGRGQGGEGGGGASE